MDTPILESPNVVLLAFDMRARRQTDCAGAMDGHRAFGDKFPHRSNYSFGELLSVDCDFVVREGGMHGRNRIFRHMASHTVVV